jgi:hypothetical protein
MTRVTILPLPTKDGDISYHALAGDKESIGRTAGEALDSLTSQLSNDEKGTMIIVKNHKPDQFFGAEQQERLAQLMNDWREARDQGSEFPNDKYLELRALVDAELEATAERATALFEG